MFTQHQADPDNSVQSLMNLLLLTTRNKDMLRLILQQPDFCCELSEFADIVETFTQH